MASSSVSQESLDLDDLDISARRNRIRVHRGHSGRGSMPYRGPPERGDAGDQDRDGRGDPSNGEVGDGDGGSTLPSHGHLPVDHDSPTRGATARLKDKRSRPNHVKGKLPKDKRKLREKRRSTGVVHCIPSTESTGDSLDDEDDEEDAGHDTKKNTMFNEGPSPGHHHHQTTYEGRHSSNPVYSHPRRNKSPSDLEADLEDNQDYDSTVSHSETNLSLIGRSESLEMTQNLPGRQQPGTVAGDKFGVGKINSKNSSEPNQAFKLSTDNVSSDADSSRTNNTSTSSSSSLFSRYKPAGITKTGSGDAPDSDSVQKNGTSTAEGKQPPQQIPPRPAGFSVFSNTFGQRGDKSAHSSYVYSASKFRDRESGLPGSVSSRMASYQAPRPFVSSSSASASGHQQNETVAQLQKQLEKEREENSKLQQLMEEKEKKIAELLKEIDLLNLECDGLDEDNIKLQEENKALIRAMSKLTSNV